MKPEDDVTRTYGISEDSITTLPHEGADELERMLQAYKQDPKPFR
jgi:hypothetical protein